MEPYKQLLIRSYDHRERHVQERWKHEDAVTTTLHHIVHLKPGARSQEYHGSSFLLFFLPVLCMGQTQGNFESVISKGYLVLYDTKKFREMLEMGLGGNRQMIDSPAITHLIISHL